MKTPLPETEKKFGSKGFCNWCEFLKYYSQHQQKVGNV